MRSWGFRGLTEVIITHFYQEAIHLLTNNNLTNPYKDPEDKLVFAKILDKLSLLQKNKKSTHTDFLDPISCAKFMQTLERGRYDVFISTYGGFEDAERRIILFDVEETVEFPIVPIKVTYNQRFSKPPTHRDYLGAVLGLGISRSKVGDICLEEDGATMYVIEDIANYIIESLNQVGRVTVKASVGSLETSVYAEPKVKRITVASMRLDGVLSSGFNISRGKASAFIESEKVFVNWKLGKKNHIVAVGDTITLRGVGRIKINSQLGNSKKDRIVLEVLV